MTGPVGAERPPAGTGWRAAGAGLALLLAAAPVGTVVQGRSWWLHAAGAVAVVALAGAAARRGGPVAVAAAQLAGLAMLVTALFAGSGVLGVLPGPAALGELGALLTAAGEQVRTGVPPVPATPAVLLLVTVAFGVLAVVVDAVVVGAGTPAAAGVPLLAVFAVPTAVADGLLPWEVAAAAAAGFGLLLVLGGPAAVPAPAGERARRLGGAAALTAAATAVALVVTGTAGGVGTAGRLPGSGTGGRGEIGLSPFTALRGQLGQGTPGELFRVTGLPRPSYLRALTLGDYVPDAGWQPSRPAAGTPLTGALPEPPAPGDRVTVQVENLGFRDYWLPLVGAPLAVRGVADDRWAYDATTDTAYSSRPRQEASWTQDALLPTPTAADLRAAGGAEGVSPSYLDTTRVDPRVAALAADVTRGAATDFDRAVALNVWFTGPGSAFRYDLSTAPGTGDDALVEFLTVGRRGFCEQFASAMAVMLRTVGVPARVAVGFTGGRPAGEGRVVGTADAHAWVEAWFAGAGWTVFDPTPLDDGRAIVPPYVAEAMGEAAIGEAAIREAAGGGDAAVEAAAPAPEPARPEPAPAPGGERRDVGDGGVRAPPPTATPSGTSWVLPVILAAGVAAALGAVPAAVRRRQRSRRLAAAAAGGPGAAAAAWEEVLAESTDRGVGFPATDTVRDAAGRLVRGHGLAADAQEALGALVVAVEQSRYGGVEPAPGSLDDPLRRVRAGLAAATPLHLRRRLLPQSVTTGVTGWRPARPGADDTDAVASRW
jgi:transglutaminase-like putative cysteine protease